MRHLQPRPLKPTLDIKPLVRLATIQNTLIAPDLLGDVVERLDDAQTKLLALLVLGHGNVLDVANEPEVVDEFALDDEGAGADDLGRGVEDGEEEVLVVVLGEPFVARVPLLWGRVIGFVGLRDGEGVRLEGERLKGGRRDDIPLRSRRRLL
jgi:hypothetical protein